MDFEDLMDVAGDGAQEEGAPKQEFDLSASDKANLEKHDSTLFLVDCSESMMVRNPHNEQKSSNVEQILRAF